VQVGMSTKQIADQAKTILEKLGGKPAFLGYYGFPDVICISVNEEVVHGIPRSDKILQDGDIVSLDFGVLHKGLITDAAFSMIVGSPKSKRDEQIIKATRQSLD